MRLTLKKVLTRLVLSAAATVIIGTAALVLYFFSYCLNGSTDCLAYSPIRKWIAFLLAPPVFLMQRWFFGKVDNVADFDPVIFGRFGWAALWAYYFVVISAAIQLIKRYRTRRTKRKQQSVARIA